MGKIIGFFGGKIWWLKVAGSLLSLFLVFKLLMFLWGVVAFANPEVKDLSLALVKANDEVLDYARTDSILRSQKDSCEALRLNQEKEYQLQIIELTQAAKKYENRAVYAEAQNTALKKNGACKYATEIKVGPFLNKRKGLIYTSEPCRGDTVWLD